MTKVAYAVCTVNCQVLAEDENEIKGPLQIADTAIY